MKAVRALGRWMGVVGVLMCGVPAEAARRMHLAPAARGDGSGRNAANARKFDAGDFNRRVIPDARDFEVEVRMAPGVYPVWEPLAVYGGANQGSYIVRIIGEGERPEDVVFLNELPYRASGHERMARFQELRRIEIENVTFDGNWDARMKQAGHPSLSFGYKNQPLTATAVTGRVRRVIVRHHGGIGFMPHTRFDNPAGVETFPLAVGTVDVGQEPDGEDPRPWVVEDCEIHGFHSEYSGYTTLMMAGAGNLEGQSPGWIGTEADRRLLLVRRNQIRGMEGGLGVIAMGSSGCGTGYVDGGRTTFTDNLILNASLGFNTDCGRISNLDFTNSLFLDVWAVGNANASHADRMKRYRITDNAVRFGHRQEFGQYRQFGWVGRRMTTDLALPLGRTETNELAGLFLGATEDFVLARNWFTGRIPAARGPESGPAEFRVLKKLGPVDFPWGGGSAQASDFDGSGNAVSGVSWDFARLEEVPGGRMAKLPVGGGGELVRFRTVPNVWPGGFRPMGYVERVLPVYGRRTQRYEWLPSSGTGKRRSRTLSEPALAGAIEVAIGQPTAASSGEWIIPVRLAMQSLPGRGETRPLAGSNVWLQVSGAVQMTGSGVTDARGITEFRLRTGEIERGHLQLLAFHDPEARSGAEGRYREYRVASARAGHAIGTVVEVMARPDVADERTGQPGVFQLSRTRDHSGGLPGLEVAFRVGREPRSATYGLDYRLELDGPGVLQAESARQGGVARIRFPEGVDQLRLNLVPVFDEVIEQERVTLELITGGRLPYALSGAASATVYINDGSDWNRRDLPAPAGARVRVTSIGPVLKDGDRHVVHIGGLMTRRGERERPAYWRWDLASEQPEWMAKPPADWEGVAPAAFTAPSGGGTVSVAGVVDPDDRSRAAGWIQGKRVTSAGRISGVSPDGSWWVGVKDPGGEPVLGTAEGSLAAARGEGWKDIELKAVNVRGVVAGQGQRGAVLRAFRTTRVDGIPAGDLLPLLDGTEESGVTAIDAGGIVAGWCGKGTVRRGCVWIPTGAGGTGGVRVAELARPVGQAESVALGFSMTGEVLAMAGNAGKLLVPYVASLNHGGHWPLDDPSNVFGVKPGENAGEAVAMNPQGWVLGTRPGPGGSVIGWVARRQARQ